MTCHTCTFARLHLPMFAECTKEIDDEALYENWMCPEEFTCLYWEQASEGVVEINSIDWSQAPIIEVD